MLHTLEMLCLLLYLRALSGKFLFEICKTVVVDLFLQIAAGGTKSSDLLIEVN